MGRVTPETVELRHVDHTDSILMGPVIDTFTEPVRGDVCAAGRWLRVSLRGVDGYVDIDTQQAVDTAVKMLRGEL